MMDRLMEKEKCLQKLIKDKKINILMVDREVDRYIDIIYR